MVARTQAEHAAINAREYPGTRQLCALCDEPTGRCEEDAIWVETDVPGCECGPLCPDCYHMMTDATPNA